MTTTTTPDTNPNPRAPIADAIATAAANYAATVAAGPDTVGAVLTHAGNYIIPASTDGFATCPDDVHVGVRRIPVTKFPTRPAAIDGSVPRDMRRCRACRDARTVANRAARTVAIPAPVPAPVDPRDDRMAAAWGGSMVDHMAHVADAAAVTITRIASGRAVPFAGNAPVGA